MTDSLTYLYERDLDRLAHEIGAFKNEATLWQTPGDVNNSAGNLAIHLCGNLQHFIGAIIGKTGYVRDRAYEFAAKDVPRDEIIARIKNTKQIVLSTLKNMDNSLLSGNYPMDVIKDDMSTEVFLIHLHGHLTYHLGQISYFRRILEQ